MAGRSLGIQMKQSIQQNDTVDEAWLTNEVNVDRVQRVRRLVRSHDVKADPERHTELGQVEG